MPGDLADPRGSVRVLRIITRLNVGGPSIHAITLSDRLAARGFHTLLVHGRLGEGEGDMRYLLPETVERVYVSSLRRPVAPAHDGVALMELYRLLRRTRPAVVHTHTAKAGTLGRLAAAFYNRRRGLGAPARVVHTYHGHVLDGYFGSRAARFFTSAERQLGRLTDAIVAISPQIRDELLNDHGIGRVEQYHVIRLGFDLRPLIAIDDEARRAARTSLDVPADAHVVSTVGRLTAVKQHRLFLETAQRIAARDQAALFLIAGDGELRAELEQTARDLGIGHRTRFLGWRRDLATIYGATDVFLLTSRNEGTPVALIESLAAGVPGVSTDVGGVRDVIDSREIGLVASAGDAGALADDVITLMTDVARRRAMGERGRRAMIARYGVDRLVDETEALYRNLLSGRGAS